jgi:hypothetical protein
VSLGDDQSGMETYSRHHSMQQWQTSSSLQQAFIVPHEHEIGTCRTHSVKSAKRTASNQDRFSGSSSKYQRYIRPSVASANIGQNVLSMISPVVLAWLRSASVSLLRRGHRTLLTGRNLFRQRFWRGETAPKPAADDAVAG